MDEELLKEFIISAHSVAQEYRTVFVDKVLSDFNEDDELYINGFHPRKIYTINMEDDYFLSARANTFVVMFGVDEHSGYEKTVLIQANHKGLMHFLMFSY